MMYYHQSQNSTDAYAIMTWLVTPPFNQLPSAPHHHLQEHLPDRALTRMPAASAPPWLPGPPPPRNQGHDRWAGYTDHHMLHYCVTVACVLHVAYIRSVTHM